MGLDIYVYVEQRQPDGSWALASGMQEDRYFHFIEEDEEGELPLVPREFVLGRNSAVFAILANVRQPMGVHQYEYLSLPRGLPEDLSLELRDYAALWEYSFRYPTWLLLEEVLNFPWKEKYELRLSRVDARAAHLFGLKRSSSSGQRWELPESLHVGFPFAEWPTRVPVGKTSFWRETVTVKWLQTYEEIASDFFGQLKPFKDLGDPADIRLVIWFD